jgi:hypothetical protein
MRHYVGRVKKVFERPEVCVDEAHAFWLKKNDSDVLRVCHSVNELKQALKSYPEALQYHSNEHFASWVEKVFNDKTLARKIRIAPKKKIIRIL